jgi:hypothetical protein
MAGVSGALWLSELTVKGAWRITWLRTYRWMELHAHVWCQKAAWIKEEWNRLSSVRERTDWRR